MTRLFLDATAAIYTAINNKSQVLAIQESEVTFGDNSRGDPIIFQVYTYQRFDTTPSGARGDRKVVGYWLHDGMFAKALNDRGWVAFQGAAWRGGVTENGLGQSLSNQIWRDKLPTIPLRPLSPALSEKEAYEVEGSQGAETAALAMNQQGTAVGWSKINLTHGKRPCLWRNGVAIVLSDPSMEQNKAIGGTTHTIGGEAWGINERGVVVGWIDGYEQQCAFVWQNSAFHLLEGIRSRKPSEAESESIYETQAVAINATGVIAGHIGNHPVRWQNGTLTYLRGPHNESPILGSVWAINRAEVIVGNMRSRDRSSAVLWHGHECVDLNKYLSVQERAETKLLQAFDINDKGQIVGSAEHGGKRCGFVLDVR